MATSTKLLGFAMLVIGAGILMLGNLPCGFSAPAPVPPRPAAPVAPAPSCRGDANQINRECSGSGGWPTPKQACCVAMRLADVVCHCMAGRIRLTMNALIQLCKFCTCDPRVTSQTMCKIFTPPAPPRLAPPTMALA